MLRLEDTQITDVRVTLLNCIAHATILWEVVSRNDCKSAKFKYSDIDLYILHIAEITNHR